MPGDAVSPHALVFPTRSLTTNTRDRHLPLEQAPPMLLEILEAVVERNGDGVGRRPAA